MNRDQDTSALYALLHRANELYEQSAGPGQDTDRFKARTLAAWELAMDRPQQRRPRVFVGIPHYGDIHPDTLVAATQWASDQNLDVTIRRHHSSLLANGFNRLLMEAFNSGPWDLFCLLHADVVPRLHKRAAGYGFWLDVMVRDLYGNGLDALHVPAAVKDSRGIMSTAIGRKDYKEQWNHVKKLSVRELGLLPKVFTFRDCERCLDLTCFDKHEELCLLPNTGCMLVRLDVLREHRFPGFAFQDELHWGADGKVEAGTVPEDWHFGRWCAHAGLKVGGTTNLATSHYGPHEFVSDQDWGWQLSEYGGQPTAKVF